jgi:glycosyltransferase involved in cell wall biosynthesis
MPIRILELCLSPDYGGLELHMRDFSRWLTGRSDCRLFLALQEGTKLSGALRDLDVPRLLFSEPAGKISIFKAKRLSDFIESHSIDLVHVHWKFDLPLAALAKKLCKRKFKLVHTRQMNMPGKKGDPYHRFIYGQLDYFIAITRYIERQARENLPIPDDKIIQIYYGVKMPGGVTAERTTALKKKLNISGEFNIGLLGRISEYKGQHLLIEAMEKLRKEGIFAQAWIVGAAFEQDYLEKLKKMVTEKKLIDQIHFMDFYEPAIELMSCFDTVVLTTKNETFGLVLVEAMQAGVAVIGSNAGGVPEIIDHEKTGLLFDTWNSDSLSEAIRLLYKHQDLRHRLAEAGKKKAQIQFQLEIQYGKVLDVFKRLKSEIEAAQ